MIRLGTPEDAEGVARVHVETWQAAYAHALPREQLAGAVAGAMQPERSRRWPPTSSPSRMGRSWASSASARAATRTPTASCSPSTSIPTAWGTGIGRALIQAGEDELRRLGHHDAVLWVLDDNPRARRFYELAGWAADGAAREIQLFGFDVAEVRYAKRL